MALFSYSGADERTRTSTSLTLVPKTSASANSATSAYLLTMYILAYFCFHCQYILKIFYYKIYFAIIVLIVLISTLDLKSNFNTSPLLNATTNSLSISNSPAVSIP